MVHEYFVCTIHCLLIAVSQQIRPIFKNEAVRLKPTSKIYRRFGEVMDIDDDRLIVGNYEHDEAIIFKNDQTSWRQEASVNSPGGGRNHFGRSVGILRDLAVVGAIHDTINNQKHSGSVYLFRCINSSWSEESKLVPTDPGWYHYFGYSVAIDDLYVVVACPYYKRQSGAVYLFQKTDIGWKQKSKLLPSDPAEFNVFGHSVRIDARHIVVGTLHKNGNKEISSGTAYVFKKFGQSSWYQQMKIQPTKKLRDHKDDEFGYAIATKENYVVIGCPGDTVNGVGSGAAYIYKSNGNKWVESAKIYPKDGIPNDYFGSSVDMTDGFIVVGSRRGHYNGTQPGTAYIFQRLGKYWIERSKLVSPDGTDDANFGFTVVVNQNNTVVGCPWCKKNGTVFKGSAYLFDNIDESSFNREVNRT